MTQKMIDEYLANKEYIKTAAAKEPDLSSEARREAREEIERLKAINKKHEARFTYDEKKQLGLLLSQKLEAQEKWVR